jgi:hypothetical protein
MSSNNTVGYTFYIDPITITQDTKLVAIPTNNLEANTQTYDYLLNVNVKPLISSLNDLFLNASYSFIEENNTVGVNLTLNDTVVADIFRAYKTTISPGFVPSPLFATQDFDPANEPTAQKLKEVMAVKIFGSAGAVSAFTSETYAGYTSTIPVTLTSGLNKAFTENTVEESLMFNQYVASGRFIDDQERLGNSAGNSFAPSWVPFNFANSVFSVRLTFKGNVKDSADTIIDSTSYPTVHYPTADVIGGRTIPSSGRYEIPLLLKLHD